MQTTKLLNNPTTKIRSLSTPALIKGLQFIAGMTNDFVEKAFEKTGIRKLLNAGVNDITALANECNLNENALYRALRFSIFYHQTDFSTEKYELQPADILLLEDSFGSFRGAIEYVTSETWNNSWANFDYCLYSGGSSFINTFGCTYFDYVGQHQNFRLPFTQQMDLRTEIIANVISDSYDFSSFDTICDLGGGAGTLLYAILSKNPNVNGILVDLPITLTHHNLGNFIDRVKLLPANFFDKIDNADCIILKNVLHNWDDKNAILLLQNCLNSLNKGGKILIIDQLMETPYTLMSLFYDLHMLVLHGGAERSKSEFNDLIEKSGANLQRIIKIQSPMAILELSAN